VADAVFSVLQTGSPWRYLDERSTRFLKIIRRAGLTPWPRLVQNLRASKETDLMQHHPIPVVTVWMGNTPRIALSNYLQTLERDFEKATGVAPSGGVESGAVGAIRGAVGGAVPSRPERI
jgi:hypothetical protein